MLERFLYAGTFGQYMGMATEADEHMKRRALLTDREREVLRGDADDVKDLSQYQSKIRSRIKNRMDRLEEDVDLLEVLEPELAEELHDRICEDPEERIARVERDLAELRSRVDDEK